MLCSVDEDVLGYHCLKVRILHVSTFFGEENERHEKNNFFQDEMLVVDIPDYRMLVIRIISTWRTGGIIAIRCSDPWPEKISAIEQTSWPLPGIGVYGYCVLQCNSMLSASVSASLALCDGISLIIGLQVSAKGELFGDPFLLCCCS